MPLLEMQGLTKHYGTRRGVDDVTLNVDQGEVFGFLGPNVAGNLLPTRHRPRVSRSSRSLTRPTGSRPV